MRHAKRFGTRPGSTSIQTSPKRCWRSSCPSRVPTSDLKQPILEAAAAHPADPAITVGALRIAVPHPRIWLFGMIVGSAVARTAVAMWRPTPLYYPDEYLYSS